MNIQSIIRRILNKPAPKPVKRKYTKRIPEIRYSVKNDTSERIASLKITVPALHVGVLNYTPEELKINDPRLAGKNIHLYYPPEEVSSKKFLKNLELAPFVVGVGHGATTNEKNKKIDGWASTVHYDEIKKAAILDGVVKGKDQVDYINENIDKDKFGASAFIDFIAEVKSGVTPDGQEYNAIAHDLKVTHIALTQSVRDPENKIQVRNTVPVNNAVVVNTDGIYKSEDSKSEEKRMAEMTPEQIAAIVKNAVKEELAARNAEDEIKELKNKVKNLEDENEEMKKKEAENAAYEGKETPEEEAEEGKEKKSKDSKEDTTLENAKPTQALVAAVGTALNIDFGSKTPSFVSLANMLGIKEIDPAARIIAVNAKYAEMVEKKPDSAANSHTSEVF